MVKPFRLLPTHLIIQSSQGRQQSEIPNIFLIFSRPADGLGEKARRDIMTGILVPYDPFTHSLLTIISLAAGLDAGPGLINIISFITGLIVKMKITIFLPLT